MFNSLPILSIALVAVSSVSGLIIPRHRNIDISARAEPGTYDEKFLEAYDQYHKRYLALDCDKKHDTKFFDQCCHPLLATETLKANRPAECAPSAAALASASAALPTTTVVPDSNGNNCDDSADTTTASTPKATTQPGPGKHIAAGNAAVKESSSSTHTSTPKATPQPGPEKQIAAGKAAVKESSSSTHTSTASKSTATSSSGGDSGSSGSGSNQGGFGTFFTQNGVAGACGQVHKDSDFICAIDQARYGDSGKVSSLCGKSIRITNVQNNKSVVCQIADDCPTCANSNSVDMSVGAFTQIATESEGEVSIKWSFE